MKLDGVCKDLESRITQGRDWLASGGDLEIGGLEIRGLPCDALLADSVDSPNRVEKAGLSFLVKVASPKKTVRFQLVIRIKPQVSPGDTPSSLPYVAIYLVNQASGLEELVSHYHWRTEEQYEPWSQLTIHEWYKAWIARVLSSDSGRFFSKEVQVSDAG